MAGRTHRLHVWLLVLVALAPLASAAPASHQKRQQEETEEPDNPYPVYKFDMKKGCSDLGQALRLGEAPGLAEVPGLVTGSQHSKMVMATVRLMWNRFCNSSSKPSELLQVYSCLQKHSEQISECFRLATSKQVFQARQQALKQPPQWNKLFCWVTQPLKQCTRAACGEHSDFLADLLKLTSDHVLKGVGMLSQDGGACQEDANSTLSRK